MGSGTAVKQSADVIVPSYLLSEFRQHFRMGREFQTKCSGSDCCCDHSHQRSRKQTSHQHGDTDICFSSASETHHGRLYEGPCGSLYPDPLRCFNCQRYGHSSRACKNSCVKCGEAGHKGASCSNQELCINCKGKHAVSS